MSDDMFTSIIIFVIFFVAFLFSCLLNPLFWQALRNSKFIDDLKDNYKKKKSSKHNDLVEK